MQLFFKVRRLLLWRMGRVVWEGMVGESCEACEADVYAAWQDAGKLRGKAEALSDGLASVGPVDVLVFGDSLVEFGVQALRISGHALSLQHEQLESRPYCDS